MDAQHCCNYLETLATSVASSKTNEETSGVSVTVPKQKTIGYPKNMKPKVSWAKALIQKVIPGKGKATPAKTFLTTTQIHNIDGPAKNTRTEEPVVS